jgi:hypothetical protein
LWIDGQQQALYVEGLGRFEDLSYRSLLLQFQTVVEGQQTKAALLAFDVPRTQHRARVSTLQEDADRLPRRPGALEDPRLLGWPDAAALPDAAYVRSTKVFWEMVPEQEVADHLSTPEAKSQAQVYNQRFENLWRNFDFQGSTASFQQANILNFPNPGRYAGDTQPANWTAEEPPPYYDWRNRFLEPVSNPSYNYYDAAMISFSRWAMSGRLDDYKMAHAYAWSYMYASKYYYRDYGSYTRLAAWSYVQEKQHLPEGMGMAYLMTADPNYLDFLQQRAPGSQFEATRQPHQVWSYLGGTAQRWRNSSGLARANSYQGEGRPIARINLARLWAWKCTRPASEPDSPSVETADWEERVRDAVDRSVLVEPHPDFATDTSSQYDGRWVYYAGGALCPADKYYYYNIFMQPMVADSLIKIYESYDYRRADIRQRVKAAIDHLWQHDWGYTKTGYSTLAFLAWFGGSTDRCDKEATSSAAPDLTMMYPHVWAWYAAEANDPVYRERAETIFRWGVGYSLDGNNGPYMGATSLVSRKIRREFYCYSQNLFAFLQRAPPHP